MNREKGPVRYQREYVQSIPPPGLNYKLQQSETIDAAKIQLSNFRLLEKFRSSYLVSRSLRFLYIFRVYRTGTRDRYPNRIDIASRYARSIIPQPHRIENERKIRSEKIHIGKILGRRGGAERDPCGGGSSTEEEKLGSRHRQYPLKCSGLAKPRSDLPQGSRSTLVLASAGRIDFSRPGFFPFSILRRPRSVDAIAISRYDADTNIIRTIREHEVCYAHRGYYSRRTALPAATSNERRTGGQAGYPERHTEYSELYL